jgi:carboxymethylenebutenolidase
MTPDTEKGAAMAGSYIEIHAPDGGKFRGYLCLPRSGKGPGLVVEQEIFGINENVRLVCENYAREGYVTLAPDLFWRMEPNVDMGYSPAEWQRAFDFFKRFDVDKGIQDVAATMKQLRGMKECTGKAGAIGYCLGGKLAYLTAARTDVDCAVAYYGVGLDQNLGEKGKIRKPLLMHIAEKDQFVPPEAQAKIKAGLKDVKTVEIHSYPGVDHAFARINGDHFDKNAAELANKRTLEFLKKHLG